MTLREKFDNPIMRHDLCRNEIEETKEQCEQIAEDFAIEFAAWIQFHSELWIRYNRKELLQIFKKEHGL